MIELVIFAFLFGFFLDLADLFNEHGLNWFTGDRITFGILNGIAGVLLINTNPLTCAYVLGLIFFWLIIGKIDYLNHRIAFLIISFAGILTILGENSILLNSVIISLVLLSVYFIQKIILSKGGINYKKNPLFLGRHLIGPIICYFLFPKTELLITSFFIIIGVIASTIFFEKPQERLNRPKSPSF